MKNDSIVQTRCKRVDLATVVMWYEMNGLKIRSLSELMRKVLEGLVQVMVKNGFEPITETSRATEILEDRGLSGLNSGGRGNRNLYDNLFGGAGTPATTRYNARGGKGNIEDIVKNAISGFDNTPDGIDLEEFKKKERKRIDEFKNQLGIVPEK